jgi:superfamily I DNA/RNA helicase
LKEWFDKKIAFLVKYERLSEMATVQDRYRCLLSMIAMIHKENGHTIKDLRRFIEAVFGNENGNGVRLSSVHRAKGLECPVVYFLDYDKQVEAAEEEGIGHTSESNILYVGVTRAQRKLVMVQTSPAFRKTYYEGNKICVKK